MIRFQTCVLKKKIHFVYLYVLHRISEHDRLISWLPNRWHLFAVHHIGLFLTNAMVCPFNKQYLESLNVQNCELGNKNHIIQHCNCDVDK